MSGQRERIEMKIWAAFLVSIDHASLFFATEARPYALVELLAEL